MNQLFQKLVNYSLQQVLLFGVVLGLGYYFFIFDDGTSFRAQIEATGTEIRREEEKKKDTEATVKEEARMKEAVGQLSRQYQEVARRLPTSLASIDLNRNVDSFARNSGVGIKSRKPMALISREIVDEVPIQVTLEGTYSDLAQFVYLVSSSEKVTSMRTFTLTSIEPHSSRLKMEGTVVGYQLSDETKAEKAKDSGKKKGAP